MGISNSKNENMFKNNIQNNALTHSNPAKELKAKELFESDYIIPYNYNNQVSEFKIGDNIDLDAYKALLTAGAKNVTNAMTCILECEWYSVYAMFGDLGGGKRNIGIKFRFSDSEVTETINIKQADFLKMVQHLKDKAEIENKNTIVDGKKKLPATAKKDAPKLTVEQKSYQKVYEKFRDTIQDYQQKGSLLEADAIINALETKYVMIPAERIITDIDELAHIYGKVYERVLNDPSIDHRFTMGTEKSQYFRVMPYLFKSIAEELKITEIKLAKYLYEKGLVYAPEYSIGYQTKVHNPNAAKDESPKQWVYLVLKPTHFTNNLQYDLGDVVDTNSK